MSLPNQYDQCTPVPRQPKAPPRCPRTRKLWLCARALFARWVVSPILPSRFRSFDTHWCSDAVRPRTDDGLVLPRHGFGWPLVTLITLTGRSEADELASACRPRSNVPLVFEAGGNGMGLVHRMVQHPWNLTVLAGIDYGCAQFVTPLLGLNATTTNLLICVCCNPYFARV